MQQTFLKAHAGYCAISALPVMVLPDTTLYV
jgi:hypothetical protein